VLDVHAAHETPHGWKAFFIQIATIAVGLLIAIGLEQTVEYLHHRHQARDMAEMLRDESTQNLDVARYDLGRIERIKQAIEANFVALDTARRMPGKTATTLTPIPADNIFMPGDAAWITMRDSALLPIVPKTLVGNYWKIETTLQILEERYRDSARSKSRVNGLLKLQPAAAVLEREEVEALRQALSEYREHVQAVHSLLLSFLAANGLALAGKEIDLASQMAAKEQLTEAK
jgi:hypothetical protein